jgi:lipase chaperone LimK
MDYVWFVLIIAALAGLWWLTKKFDCRAKNRYRLEAYRLLDKEDASEEEIKKVLKGLLLYGGRVRQDKEFLTLRQRLSKKLETLSSSPGKI